MTRQETHPHSLKQLSQQNHKVDLKTQQTIINRERHNTKENIRNCNNISSDNDMIVGKWYDQDLVMANVFLYLKPMELFLLDEGCLMVCKSWNQLISGQEFAKYYFENSFCVSSPFFNHQNQHEFDDLDTIQFNLDSIIDDKVEKLEDSEDELKFADEPLDALTCVKCFENELGYKTKLAWKNNFYKKFLELVSLMEKRSTSSNNLDDFFKTVSISEIIENLLKPLNQPQIDKLNSVLKKLKFSKLLTNAIKIGSGKIVIFSDSGLPHIISFTSHYIFINHICGQYVRHCFVKGVFSGVLPQCTVEEEKTFVDVLFGLFPSAVQIRKGMSVKRTPTPYILFSQHKRKQVLAENYWKELSENEKQPFIEEAQKVKVERQSKLDNFQYIISGLNETEQ